MTILDKALLLKERRLRFFDPGLVEFKNRPAIQANNVIVVFFFPRMTSFVEDEPLGIGERLAEETCFLKHVHGSVNSGGTNRGMLHLHPPDHLLNGQVSPLGEDRLRNHVPLFALIELLRANVGIEPGFPIGRQVLTPGGAWRATTTREQACF